MMHPRQHVAEISEASYFHLMHDLSLAGANRKTSYGSGWIGSHPQFGEIAVSRVNRPARHRRHPPFAFYVVCANDDTLAQVQDALANKQPPLAHPR